MYKRQGLGLSIVKTVLDLHKAKYGVESTLGEGSNFWFELNITDIHAIEPPPETEHE